MYYCVNYSCFGVGNNRPMLSHLWLDYVTEWPLTILVLGCLLSISVDPMCIFKVKEKKSVGSDH